MEMCSAAVSGEKHRSCYMTLHVAVHAADTKRKQTVQRATKPLTLTGASTRVNVCLYVCVCALYMLGFGIDAYIYTCNIHM